MSASIYLLRGGNKRTGYFLLPQYFNYKKHAVKYRDQLNYQKTIEFYDELKVVKFVSVEPTPTTGES